jgi:hypothetical protein
VKQEWASPRSTLHDNALWDSDTDGESEADEMATTAAERIGALACTASALPDWDSDEGWIHVLGDGEVSGVHDSPPADADCFVWAEASEAECETLTVAAADGSNGIPRYGLGLIDGASIWQDGYLCTLHLGSCRNQFPHLFDSDGDKTVSFERECNIYRVMKLFFAEISPVPDQSSGTVTNFRKREPFVNFFFSF